MDGNTLPPREVIGAALSTSQPACRFHTVKATGRIQLSASDRWKPSYQRQPRARSRRWGPVPKAVFDSQSSYSQPEKCS